VGLLDRYCHEPKHHVAVDERHYRLCVEIDAALDFDIADGCPRCSGDARLYEEN
jgi:hypothetical protein